MPLMFKSLHPKCEKVQTPEVPHRRRQDDVSYNLWWIIELSVKIK